MGQFRINSMGLGGLQTASSKPPEVDAERAPSRAALLEVSWEVCNQLGGIYQVIRSKAPTMVNRWRERYLLVGPYVPARAALECEERRASGWVGRMIDALAGEGLVIRHGRWLVPGRPRVLLVEHESLRHQLDEIKFRLWEQHGIESPSGDGLIDGSILFGEAVRRLIVAAARAWMGPGAVELDDHGSEADTHAPHAADNGAHAAISNAGSGGSGGGGGGRQVARRMIAHYHEWLGGVALPLLHRQHPSLPVASVFTTHATQLGRTIAWGDEWFYDHLPFLDHAHEAAKFNIRCQHGIERACAHACNVFTTVSPITGEECAHLLGRQPDMVLANGLNIDHYNVGHDFQTFHAQFKEKINRFVMGHFFPSYAFDLDRTLYFFTSGRFEPRNKGFDLCLEALARLNAELKNLRAQGIERNVVFFIVTQRKTRSLHPRALHQRGVLNELHDVCQNITQELGDNLFRTAAAHRKVPLEDMIGEYWNLRFRRTQHAFKTDQLPLVVTHLLEDDAKDEVLNQIRQLWLFNQADDPVKIVYHPEFITPTNPLWGLEYEQFVRGCHMGIFPSAYEPWGYTPLECLAMGVPAVTSDLSGFGRYVQETIPDLCGREGGGLYVLNRRGRTFHEAAHDLSRHMLEFCKLDRRDRIQLRNNVEARSWEFDWAKLGQAYDWAHDLAMIRAAAI